MKRATPHDLPREFRSLAEEAVRQGWKIYRTHGCHFKWLSPTGKGCVFSAGSPRDFRATANTRTKLKRYGFK